MTRPRCDITLGGFLIGVGVSTIIYALVLFGVAVARGYLKL